MNIEKDCVVQFHYQIKDSEGQVLENSANATPIAYLHGHNNIFPGIEAALAGKAAGDKVEATLAPEETYGERQDNAIQRIPAKHLQGAKKWQKGMVATIQTEEGPRQVTVVKVGKFMVDVDANHPFAGLTLTFDMEVTEVRPATAEELEHGHAHGVGGHHH